MKNLMDSSRRTLHEIATFPINALQEYSKTKKAIEKLLVELRSLDNLIGDDKSEIKEANDTNSKINNYLSKEKYKEITKKIYQDF